MLRQEFLVQLIVASTHEYIVTAASEEEAVSIAEGVYGSGDHGEVLDWDIETADAFASDDTDEEEFE